MFKDLIIRFEKPNVLRYKDLQNAMTSELEFGFQIMTPLCIFAIDACDKWRPLGNKARFTFESALES